MHYEASVLVRRPIEEVWAFLTDPLNLPRWSDAWRGSHLTSPGPIRPGTTFQGRRVILGVAIPWNGEVIEWDPPNTFGYSVMVLGARSRMRMRLESTLDGTRVVRVGEREPRPAQQLLSRILGPWLVRHHDARDQRLKQLLEAGLR